jgi:hypothetical protein
VFHMKTKILNKLKKWFIHLPECKRGGTCNCDGVIYKPLRWDKRRIAKARHVKAGLYCTRCMHDVTDYTNKSFICKTIAHLLIGYVEKND